jgi:hypothetical protein
MPRYTRGMPKVRECVARKGVDIYDDAAVLLLAPRLRRYKGAGLGNVQEAKRT